MRKILLFIAVFLTVIFNTFSQSPESFNYQSVVRDSGGIIIANQTVGLQFTIYQTSATGTMVYRETFALSTNNFGLVNVQIGTGTIQSGIFADIDWSSGPYFLETAIDVTGGTSYSVMGTSQLVSVPYALFAKTSGDTSWSVNDNNTGIAYKSGIVGIGTGATNAFEQFEVRMNQSDANATNIRIYNLDNSTQTRMVITNDALSSIALGINSSASSFGPNEAFLWYFDDFDFKIGVGGFERMRIKNDGKIGIGTATPGSQLQVTGGDIYVENIGTGMILKSPDGNCWRITVDNTGNLTTASVTCPVGI